MRSQSIGPYPVDLTSIKEEEEIPLIPVHKKKDTGNHRKQIQLQDRERGIKRHYAS